MSVKCYDDAIVKRFRAVFGTNDVYVLPVENAIRFTAQLKRDNITFPLISTTRLGYSVVGENVNETSDNISAICMETLSACSV